MRSLVPCTELKARGFLFIGDPHVSGIRPGRRNDDFTASVLGKLEQAAAIAHERQLIPVILGDLIHRNNENSVTLITHLMMVLAKFPCLPIDIEGSHGKSQTRPTIGDVEVLLAQAGVLQLVAKPGLIHRFDFEGRKVALYATPFGEAIPRSLGEYGSLADGETRILVTHHDLAFDGGYPGAAPLQEVAGAHMLVNGHMHKTARSEQHGMTMLHCPGNIEPLSVDCIDHVPCVWEWTPDLGNLLKPHPLEHMCDCFDLTGHLVVASDATVAVEALTEKSKFAEELLADVSMEAERTDEAAILLEDLAAVLADSEVSDATAKLLRALAQDVSADAQSAASAV